MAYYGQWYSRWDSILLETLSFPTPSAQQEKQIIYIFHSEVVEGPLFNQF